MAIEFNCPHCGSVLQVPDDAAGRSTLCPKCEQVTRAPSPDPRPDEPPVRENQADEPMNPFAPPVAVAEPSAIPLQGSSEIRPTEVTVSQVFEYSFAVWKSNLGILIGVTVIMIIVSMIISVVGAVVGGVIAQGDQGVYTLIKSMFDLIDGVARTYLNIGLASICLSVCRGRHTTIDMLFSGGDRFLPILGTSIIAFFAVVFGFMMLIVPGVILILFFWPYYYLIVDKQCPALDSFSLAYSFAKPNAGTSFLLGILGMAIMLIGLLAFCVGIIAAVPLLGVLSATAYLMMKGEIPPGANPPGRFDAPMQTPAPM